MLAILLASAASVQNRTINVFAAASLKEAFTQIARRYEGLHPGVTVRLSFSGSQTLAAQINQGAPADVFASAAEKNVRDIQFEAGSHRVFVLNRLEVALRKGLTGVRTMRDLDKVPVFVVADPAVPVGRYTESFFSKAVGIYGADWLARIRSHIVSREQDVRAVLTKVALGEADAGVVYVSDVAAARGKIVSLPIPDRLNETVSYPVAIPTFSANKNEAKHFIKYLLEPESQKSFDQAGFVSITRPVDFLSVASHRRTLTVALSTLARAPQVTVATKNEEGKETRFKGALIASQHWFASSSTATFIGADGYSQTISCADLKSRKAVLVRGADGNYELIVPGLKPNVWVNWLRRIELR